MRNILLVGWREYTENARTKGFWIGIFLLPLILLLSMQIPVLLEKKGKPARYFVMADFSGRFEAVIEQALLEEQQQQVLRSLNDYLRDHWSGGNIETNHIYTQYSNVTPETVARFMADGGAEAYLKKMSGFVRTDAKPFKEPALLFARAPLPVTSEEAGGAGELANALKPWLRGERTIEVGGRQVKLDAGIIIPRLASPAAGGSNSIQFWSANLADRSLVELVENTVNSEVRRQAYLSNGLDINKVREVENTRVPVVGLNPKKEEGKESVSRADIITQWAPVAFVYLLWVSIFSISQMLLSTTIEEKSNRIIEVLLSSVTPGELVMGKLAGIAAVGLTTVTAWVGSFAAVLLWKAGVDTPVAKEMLPLIKSSPLIPAFLIYFIFGFVLYAALIVAVGSVCNTLKESQNYMGVIMIFMMVPLLTMTFIPKDPNGTLATVLSWIPIYTPFVMMNRAAAGPPLFDVIGTFILLVISTIGALWGAVKIFRVGTLRTGQPPRLPEIICWLWRAD
ncbi:MAG: ABC transporter permease [Verrucomicrobiota bacterium]|nr:ABC transporter permease [Verrucomicrobiota bacterium]